MFAELPGASAEEFYKLLLENKKIKLKLILKFI